MAAVLSAVGGAAGTVAGGVVGVVGGVATGVCAVGRRTLDLMGVEYEEEEDISEVRARVDQVLHFFDVEYERYEGYFQDTVRVEQLRVEYLNCVNAVEFQNEMLAQLVDELLETRSELRRSAPAGRKDICIRLEHLRLDIGDRKNKRFFKEKERRTLLEQLSPLIAEAKTARLLEEQRSEARAAEDASTPAALGRRGQQPLAGEDQVAASEVQTHQTKATQRRRYKRYSDEELASLLRDRDSG